VYTFKHVHSHTPSERTLCLMSRKRDQLRYKASGSRHCPAVPTLWTMKLNHHSVLPTHCYFSPVHKRASSVQQRRTTAKDHYSIRVLQNIIIIN